jgi:hypothetical protein
MFLKRSLIFGKENSVRRITVRKADAREMRWRLCHEGPTIHFDRPRAGAPAPHLIHFPVGRPFCGGRVQSRCAMGSGGTFQSSPAYRHRRSGKRMRGKCEGARGGMCTRYNGRCAACLRPPPARNPRPSLHSFPCGPAAPTSRSDVQIAASSNQTQLITGPSLAVGTPCSSRTAVA